MTSELYEKVKEEIPSHIGVYIRSTSVKRAKKQKLLVDEETLKNSLIRSLSRETEKVLNSENPLFADSMRRQLNNERRNTENYRQQYLMLLREVQEKFGPRWQRHEYKNLTEE